MTTKQYNNYLKKHTAISVYTASDFEFIVNFSNGKSITVHNGIYGFYYTKSWERKKPNATKALFDDLNKLMPETLKRLKEKYNDKSS